MTYFLGSIRFSSIALLNGVPWVYLKPPKYVSQVSEWSQIETCLQVYFFANALNIGK